MDYCQTFIDTAKKLTGINFALQELNDILAQIRTHPKILASQPDHRTELYKLIKTMILNCCIKVKEAMLKDKKLK